MSWKLRATRSSPVSRWSSARAAPFRLRLCQRSVSSPSCRCLAPISRADAMSKYIVLSKLNSNGLKTIRDDPDRIHQAERDVTAHDGKLIQQWALLGGD